MEMLSTKISGLAVDTEYSFHMVLRTSGGTYSSNTLTVRTQKMTDLTGITVTPGVLPAQLRETLDTAVERIGAKIADTVRIDTTHFVCTEGRGHEWERAVEMNIPVVRPEWVEGCEREGKIVGVRGYYLDANPKHRQVGSNPQIAASPAPTVESQTSLPSRPTPKSPGTESMGDGPGPEVPPTPVEKELPLAPKKEESEDEEEEEEDEDEEVVPSHEDAAGMGAEASNVTVEEEDEDEDEDDGPEKSEKMEDVAL